MDKLLKMCRFIHFLYIHIQDAGALTYDEVVINSDNVREYYLELLNKLLIFDFSSLQKIGVNSEGYSTMNTGQVIFILTQFFIALHFPADSKTTWLWTARQCGK